MGNHPPCETLTDDRPRSPGSYHSLESCCQSANLEPLLNGCSTMLSELLAKGDQNLRAKFPLKVSSCATPDPFFSISSLIPN